MPLENGHAFSSGVSRMLLFEQGTPHLGYAAYRMPSGSWGGPWLRGSAGRGPRGIEVRCGTTDSGAQITPGFRLGGKCLPSVAPASVSKKGRQERAYINATVRFRSECARGPAHSERKHTFATNETQRRARNVSSEPAAVRCALAAYVWRSPCERHTLTARVFRGRCACVSRQPRRSFPSRAGHSPGKRETVTPPT